jgi:ribosomal protein L37AE/L43A
MVDVHLPRIVAGYAFPICPNCDKEHGPEVANAGPVQCDECGKWFEVTARTVYQAEQRLDYVGGKPEAAAKPD